MMMADMKWSRSRIRLVKLEEFSCYWNVAEESASGCEVNLRGGLGVAYKQIDGGLLGVRSKEMVQRRLKNLIEDEIEKHMITNE